MKSKTNKESHPARLVVLTERDAAEARRLLGLLGGSGNLASDEASSESEGHSRDALRQVAQKELLTRQRRTRLFPRKLMRDVGWEILLTLYVQQGDGPMAISRLSSAIDTAATSVLRWLQYLMELDLIIREANPSDQRSVTVGLTSNAIQKLDTYFASQLPD